MGDRIKMLFVVFLFVPFFLWAEEVQLNLPERFDAKIMKGHYYSTNGNYPIKYDKEFYEHDPQPESCRIIHFVNGKFYLNCKYVNSSQKAFPRKNGAYAKDYVILKLEGTYTKDGLIKGSFTHYSNVWEYNTKYTIPSTFSEYKDSEKGEIEGEIKGDKIFVKQHYTKKKYYTNYTEYISDTGLYKVTGKWKLIHPAITPIKATYDLNILAEISSQTSTQTEPIPNEPEPIQPQANTNISPQDDKVTLNTDTQEQPVQPQQPQKEQDPCTPPIDDAWQEYCEAKAYNAKIKEQEEADAKAAEQDAKEEEAYQKRLAAWNEEQRQSNIKFVKSRKAEIKKVKEIWDKEDKTFNDSIAKEQAKRKAKQAEIKKAHDIIDRFGDDYETQRAAHKKVEALAKSADTQKAKKIKNAIRKQFYDSKQIKLQADAEFQANRAKELDKRAKRLETVRDTAVTANKVLATVYGGALIEGIAQVHESATNAIDAAQKDGWEGALVSVVKDGVNSKTFNMGSNSVDMIFHSTQLHTKKGAMVPEGMKVYDKNGYLVKRIKANKRYFDKKGKDISFSVKRKVLTTKSFIARSEDDFKKGDVNKKVNTFMDVWGTTTDIVGTAVDLVGKAIRR
ncbi:hypothetical protein [Sulfurovum sp.]|uniref:hypothetical protein n=1 Tax=Sulfurovum sp. TaxID=1969726 RepID=UPI0025CE8DFC|nr:hypothetical protein [Sulfurovum sp.]